MLKHALNAIKSNIFPIHRLEVLLNSVEQSQFYSICIMLMSYVSHYTVVMMKAILCADLHNKLMQ